MQKIFVWVGLTAFLIATLFWLDNIKKSYEIFQMIPPPNWKADRYAGWHLYQSPTEKFSVLLPVIPQRALENVTDPKTQQVRHYDMYVSQAIDGTTFLISLIQFPDTIEVSTRDNLIPNFINDLVTANPKNVLKNSRPVLFQNHPSTRFEIENDLMNINGISFMIEDTLYVLSTLVAKGQFAQQDFDYFINSFKLLTHLTQKEG